MIHFRASVKKLTGLDFVRLQKQNAAQGRDERIRAQNTTLEQPLGRLNGMARPPPVQPAPVAPNLPPPMQLDYQAANVVAPDVPCAVN